MLAWLLALDSIVIQKMGVQKDSNISMERGAKLPIDVGEHGTSDSAIVLLVVLREREIPPIENTNNTARV